MREMGYDPDEAERQQTQRRQADALERIAAALEAANDIARGHAPQAQTVTDENGTVWTRVGGVWRAAGGHIQPEGGMTINNYSSADPAETARTTGRKLSADRGLS